jgi:hypothetical protein
MKRDMLGWRKDEKGNREGGSEGGGGEMMMMGVGRYACRKRACGAGTVVERALTWRQIAMM